MKFGGGDKQSYVDVDQKQEGRFWTSLWTGGEH